MIFVNRGEEKDEMTWLGGPMHKKVTDKGKWQRYMVDNPYKPRWFVGESKTRYRKIPPPLVYNMESMVRQACYLPYSKQWASSPGDQPYLLFYQMRTICRLETYLVSDMDLMGIDWGQTIVMDQPNNPLDRLTEPFEVWWLRLLLRMGKGRYHPQWGLVEAGLLRHGFA